MQLSTINLKYLFFIFLVWSLVIVNPDGFLYEDDEGAYLYISSTISQGKTLYSDVLAAKPPLLFWLGSIIYKIFGNNIKFFRYTASITGLITIILIFFIIKQTGNQFSALICSLLFSLDPIVFTQMRLFRTDIFALFFIAAAFYFVLQKKNIIDIFLVTIFASLAVLTRDDAFIYISFILIFFAIKDRDKRLILIMPIILLVFLMSIYFRGIGQVTGSFAQQIDLSNIDLNKKIISFYNFALYMTKNYPIWLIFPLISIAFIRFKRENNLLFSILFILLNLTMIFISDSHYIRYVLILVIARLLLIGDLLNIFSEKFKYIVGTAIILLQVIINPPPISELSFKDTTIKTISEYMSKSASSSDILLADYGYFNFHSGIKGTSISGYISGGSTKTGEINSDRVIKVIENENVSMVLLHISGRLYYPYGSEIYYFEPHHIEGMKDLERFNEYLDKHFTKDAAFTSDNGPVFVLYRRNIHP